MIPDLGVIKQFEKLSIACISDALDTYGINGGLSGIVPVTPGLKCVGLAYTLAYEPVQEGELGKAGDFIDEVPADHVVVIHNGGRLDCTVWGDILTYVAKSRGVKGTVIDGCCRDVPEIIAMNYPIFSKGRYMKSGKNRVFLAAKQSPIQMADKWVHPGDLVCADDSGVIVVPQESVLDVLSRALEIEKMESELITDLKSGLSLVLAREKHRYNQFALKTDNQ
jgi:4-hydroxy-4-methyl-2-oxoglutarate aldolase